MRNLLGAAVALTAVAAGGTCLAARGGHEGAGQAVELARERADAAWRFTAAEGGRLAQEATDVMRGRFQQVLDQLRERGQRTQELALPALGMLRERLDQAGELASNATEAASQKVADWASNGQAQALRLLQQLEESEQLSVLRDRAQGAWLQLQVAAGPHAPPHVLAFAALLAGIFATGAALSFRPSARGLTGDAGAKCPCAEDGGSSKLDAAAGRVAASISAAPSPQRKQASRRSRAASPAPAAAAASTRKDPMPPSRPSAGRRASRGGRAASPSAVEATEPCPEELILLAIINDGTAEDILSIKGVGPRSCELLLQARAKGPLHRLSDVPSLRPADVGRLLASARM